MTPNLSQVAAQTRNDDRRREAEHDHAVEVRVRQMLRRTPPRQRTRRRA